MIRRDRDIILVYGKTGMGKTCWTRTFLRSLPRVFVMDPIVEYEGLLFGDLGDMIEHVIRYPTFRARTEFVDDFPMLCSVALAAGRCWLVVEEAQRVLPASRRELPASFQDIVYRGRHKQISLLMVSQRPSTVHIAARSQWTRIITFNQTETADLAWLESVSGFELDPQGLRPFEYYDIAPSGCQKKLLDMGRRRMIPLGVGREPSPIAEEEEEP